MLKKLVWFTAVTVIAALSVVWCLNAFGFRSPVFAFLLNWLAMSWIALTGQMIELALPPGYYDIKHFEETGRLYERLGVRLFKKLVRRGPLTIFSPTLRMPAEKTLPALQHLDHEMRKAETGHLFIFVLMLLFTCYALLQRWFDVAGWFLLFNVFINGYPVMLQRYNRLKLQQLLVKASFNPSPR
ncbi:hypothetical protein [Promineifilum sp.]|uniref:glycosyl-4,4'-diaponeurosporenoate acyltransferase CrtO family protein n=1 Tax=Promineifilum sp. TaxID=2664178 RepID=UPI0035AF564E